MADISQGQGQGEETPPNMTLYINNLNEKIKIDELEKSLHDVFSLFGKILDVLAFKTLKHKGQAWVVFEDASSATNALRRMQGFRFYNKDMRIQYAKTKSDIIAKAGDTFVPREKQKRHEEKGGKKRKEQLDPNQAAAGLNPAYAGAYGATPPNLPHDTTTVMLQMLFNQYPGLKDVRMVETKPGIAFVEYENEMQSTVAMQALQGFKMQQNQILITYAKK